jgi:hypothetical protein
LIVITTNLLQHAKCICPRQSHDCEKAAEACRYGQPAAEKQAVGTAPTDLADCLCGFHCSR